MNKNPHERRSLLPRPRLPLGRLPSVVKIMSRGRKEPLCPDETQKRLTSLAKSLKTRLCQLCLGNPPNPPAKGPQQAQDLVRKFP